MQSAAVGHQCGERVSYFRYAKRNDQRPLLAAIAVIDSENITVLRPGNAGSMAEMLYEKDTEEK